MYVRIIKVIHILELVDTKHIFLYLEYFQLQVTAVIIWRGNLELFAQITSELSMWDVSKTYQRQKHFYNKSLGNPVYRLKWLALQRMLGGGVVPKFSDKQINLT